MLVAIISSSKLARALCAPLDHLNMIANVALITKQLSTAVYPPHKCTTAQTSHLAAQNN